MRLNFYCNNAAKAAILLRVDAAEAEVAAGDEDDVRVALLAHHAHRREARVERPVQQVVVPSNTSDDVETTKK